MKKKSLFGKLTSLIPRSKLEDFMQDYFSFFLGK
jgi:hypothetical protein